ncbi:hypothetical protein [Nonomuraea basaltis]|uniref:hypothetical protein n=1 Tax=Nonomuraea basaltis TaxID=2495887 RepID=UPI00110C56F9|nr:hypothetical protein [Nonomuraea basaltis]TMR95448.1 hypothetical protein EJK15_28490 [Nonomuraea basaltis]
MRLTGQEWWALIHGMLLGGLFLLAFAGGLAELYSLRPRMVTAQGIRMRMLRLKIGTTTMAVAAWLTVITGTWIVYPWYRAKGPDSPRSRLLASEHTAGWHEFAMEWKEHVAWISPILATVVVFIVFYYGTNLIRHERVRRTTITLFVLAFALAAVAGLFGALITKVAPVA